MANTFTVSTIFSAVDQMTAPVKRMQETVGGLQRAASGIMGAIGVGLGVRAIMDFGQEVKTVAMEQIAVKTGYESIFGGAGTKQLEFASELAKRLGLNYQAVASSYLSIAAAARGSAIGDAQVKALFLGVSQGATALHLTADQTQGAMTALQQMISKGKVQAEELRGQLGERLPGAFSIAARAMGMTTQALDKYMSTGKLTAEEFIPKFAAQMTKEFGTASEKASQSFVAMQNRFDNSVYKMQASIGEALIPAFLAMNEALAPIVEALGPAFKGVVDAISGAWNSGLIPALVVGTAVFLGLSAAVGIVQLVMVAIPATIALVNTAIAAFQLITEGATIAQWALNAAMLFGPQVVIVAIIAAIAALVAVIYLIATHWDVVVKGFMIGLDFVKKAFLSVLAVAFFPFIAGIELMLTGLIAIGKALGFDTSGLEAFKKGAESFVMENTFAGDIAKAAGGSGSDSGQQAPLSPMAASNRNTTTTNRSTVDVNLNNVPAGTGVRQKGDAPGFNLNLGVAGLAGSTGRN